MMNQAIDLIIHISLKITGHKKLQPFTFPKALLNLLGFDWFEGEITFPIFYWLQFRVYPAFYPLLMCVVSYLTVKYNIEVEPVTELDMVEQINGFIVSMTFLMGTFKIIYYRSIKEDILKLFDMSERLGILEAEKKPVNNTIRFSIAYFILLYANPGTWSIGYMWLHHDSPFNTAYPWDQKGIPGWAAGFFIDFMGAVFCAMCHTVVDISFPLVVSVLCAHIERLEYLLSKVGSGYYTDYERIGESVDLHVRLLKVVDQAMLCFDKLFVIQSVYTVLHACVLIYAVVKAPNKLEASLSSLIMLSASYAQLYMYCSYGQMMTTSFNNLIFASYNNQWYYCGTSLRKSLLLFTEACQREVSLKGFGDIQANLANYLHSIQESVSYFLILKTLTSGKD